MYEDKLIYFVRHGETSWNGLMQFQGRKDIPLNDSGLKQAKSVAIRLEKSFAPIVYSSPLKRTAQTAQCIAQNRRKIVFLEELQEINFGAWEGKTQIEVITEYGADYVRWKHGLKGAEITHGETEEQYFDRAHKVIEKLRALSDREIIVVTHGAFLKIILISLFGIQTKHLFWNYFMGNCSISAVKIDTKQTARPLFFNDCIHISLQAENEAELMQKIRALPILSSK